MNLLKYDFMYLKRTSKFIIFPAVAIVFAILSPLTAKYMNELLELLGVDFVNLPDPTVIDSYSQYISNLFEIFIIVVLFVAVSMFIRDKTKGLLPLVLSKPIDRTKYLLSKYFSLLSVLIVTLIASGLVFGYYTYVIFGEIDVVALMNVTLLFILYTMFIMSVSMLFSMLFNSYPAASILTFVTYIVLNILGGFGASVLDFLPGRIMIRITEVLLDTVDGSIMFWNLFTTIVITIGLMILSIYKFRKYDL